MITSRQLVGRAVAVASLALSLGAPLGGCATKQIGKPVVWPDPPDPARIRFVTAFRQGDDIDLSGWSRFSRALLGGSRDPGLAQPMGVAVSEDGQRLYIADHGLGRVLLADFQQKSLKLFAPDEGMGKPLNVALDADENVYVSDSLGHQILVFSRKGERLRGIGGNDLERPTGLAIDRARKLLYVSDSAHRKSDRHRVLVYDLGGKHLRDLGPREGPGGKGGGDGQFHFPAYLAVDRDGNVYVGDTMNFRIQVFDLEGKFVRKYGEAGDGPGTFARLKGLAFDSFGNLYAVDGGHSNVQILSRDFQPLMFFGGYAKKIEYFDIPSGIAIDPRTNRIYVCNEFVSRINVYELVNTKAEDSTPAVAEAKKQ